MNMNALFKHLHVLRYCLFYVMMHVVVMLSSQSPRTLQSSRLLDAATDRRNYIVSNLNTVASLIVTATDNESLCFKSAGHAYCPINGLLMMQGVLICQPPMVMSFDGSMCGMHHATFLQLIVDGC